MCNFTPWAEKLSNVKRKTEDEPLHSSKSHRDTFKTILMFNLLIQDLKQKQKKQQHYFE